MVSPGAVQVDGGALGNVADERCGLRQGKGQGGQQEHENSSVRHLFRLSKTERREYSASRDSALGRRC
jgi:hypothetical protein